MTPTAGERPRDTDILVVEAWGQGLLVGSLILMIAITAANMKKEVLLHKLIVAELALALGHGTFIFLHAPAQGWYLSATAVGLTISHTLHNVIAWMKIRGFSTSWGTRLYLITLLAAQPYWLSKSTPTLPFSIGARPYIPPLGHSSRCSSAVSERDSPPHPTLLIQI
ncbi:hypothetical protein AnigIFM49718_002353 [Aspergillus niger]|nr:hypothetical protein AnigIFM49718_002353 [Aspergillus niger]